MKRIALTFILLILVITVPIAGQTKTDNSKIDMLLIRGDYNKAIDTCKQILEVDTLNSEIYYKLGLAYQNLLFDDKSLECFIEAAEISPDNNMYNFTVSKSYYNKGKTGRAKPILLKLCAADSMNWPYAFYLTSIYMQEEKYDESIKIYNRFYELDSANYMLMDKIGFACLRAGYTDQAIDMFSKSLEINPKNTNAIKNLAYLRSRTFAVSTAIKLLTKGIEYDPTDMDMYARRATINFTINKYQEALDDYLRILSSGDSSAFNLKRAGLSFAHLFEHHEAVNYLLKAYKKDTTDLEVMSNLAQNYGVVNELKNSAYYYRRIIDLISPLSEKLGLNYLLLAEILKRDSQNVEAINAYLKSQAFRTDNGVYMIIANIYDEKLKDTPKAIRYYEQYLNKLKNSRDPYDTDYVESINKRIEALKKPKQSAKQP